MITGKQFKLKSLPSRCEPNSIYYIRETPTSKIFVYVTDNIGIPSELKDESGSGGIQNIQNTDGNLIISGSSTKNIDLQASFVNTVNSALQPNDNISNLNNDSGYITNIIDGGTA